MRLSVYALMGTGGRAARALRLLLLLVLALAAVEYLSGSILDASPLTYLYQPLYNATQPTLRVSEKLVATWPKRVMTTGRSVEVTTGGNQTQRTQFKKETAPKNTLLHNSNATSAANMTRQDLENVTSVLITKIMEGIRNDTATENPELKKNEKSLPLCEDGVPADFGPVPVNKTEIELDWVEKKYPEVQWGGRYAPPNCTARHKVAIIIPFRDRHKHLAIFLNHMHPFLMKQQIDYGIFIIEQAGNSDFNRAKLMNVGFAESQKQRPGGWQCFIFHDIDLLPLDLRNMYTCPRQPRHMSVSVNVLEQDFTLPYEEIFGGVSAMTLEMLNNVNGFSNRFWGWGGEDDDMWYRINKVGYHITRYNRSIARYAMLDHKKLSPNPKRYNLLLQTYDLFQSDGLSTLEYQVVEIVKKHLYTHVIVNIHKRHRFRSMSVWTYLVKMLFADPRLWW